MKHLTYIILTIFLTACSSTLPYKDRSLDDLHDLAAAPTAYRGQIVAFGGQVKVATEDARQLQLVLKTAVPLYYYAAEGYTRSYEWIWVSFDKQGIKQMTGIKKGNRLNVLARVEGYETQRNDAGKEVRVLRLAALAVADRTHGKDFFLTQAPGPQLYESWRNGRLFSKEQPENIIQKALP